MDRVDYIRYTGTVGLKWYKDVLPEEGALRFEVKESPLLGDVDIARKWELKDFRDASACVEFLSHKASVKYCEEKNDQYWVDDPMVDGKVIPGRFRVVQVLAMDEGRGKFPVQFLRKGFAQKIQWDEARLIEHVSQVSNDESVPGTSAQSDNPRRTLSIFFPNCDPASVSTIASSLSASEFGAISIKSESYSGTWNNEMVSSKIEPDGSGTVTFTIARSEFVLSLHEKIGTPRERDVYRVSGVPAHLAQIICDAWRAYTIAHGLLGSSSSGYLNEQNNTCDLVLSCRHSNSKLETTGRTVEWNCRYKVLADWHWGLTYSEASSVLSLALQSKPDTGVSVKAQGPSDNGDGTYDIWIFYTYRQYQQRIEDIVEKDGESVTTRTVQDGITTAGQIAAIPNMTDAAVPNVVKEQNIEVYEDCALKATTDTQTKSQVNSIDLGYENLGGDGQIQRLAWRNCPVGGTIPDFVAATPADYSYIALQINRDTKFQNNEYIAFYERKGTVNHEAVRVQAGKEAEEVELVLINRASAPTAPTVDLFVLIQTSKANFSGKHSDYSFRYAKIGTTNWTIRTDQVLSEAQSYEIACLNRQAEPATAPSVEGYVIVEKIVENPDRILKNYRYLLQKIGTTLWTLRQIEVGADTQEVEVVLLNQTVAPGATQNGDPVPGASAIPTVTDYVLVQVVVVNPEKVLSDYHYFFSRIGTTAWEQRTLEIGSAAESVQIVLLNRTGTPTTPTSGSKVLVEKFIENIGKTLKNYGYIFATPGTVGYETVIRETNSDYESRQTEYIDCVDEPAGGQTPPSADYILAESRIINPNKVLKTYIYVFVVKGTSNYTVQKSDSGTDVETMAVTYPQRNADPAPVVPTGYVLLKAEIGNPGRLLSDYTYLYSKIGVAVAAEDIQTQNRGAYREEVLAIFYHRTSAPTAPTRTGYTLVEDSKRGEGVIADYLYRFKKSNASPSAVTVSVGSPLHFKRKVEIYIGVPDASVPALITTLLTATTGYVVESIEAPGYGTGVTDVIRTQIEVPTFVDTWTTQGESATYQVPSGTYVTLRNLYFHKRGYTTDRSVAKTACDSLLAAHAYSNSKIDGNFHHIGSGIWEYESVEHYRAV